MPLAGFNLLCMFLSLEEAEHLVAIPNLNIFLFIFEGMHQNKLDLLPSQPIYIHTTDVVKILFTFRILRSIRRFRWTGLAVVHIVMWRNHINNNWRMLLVLLLMVHLETVLAVHDLHLYKSNKQKNTNSNSTKQNTEFLDAGRNWDTRRVILLIQCVGVLRWTKVGGAGRSAGWLRCQVWWLVFCAGGPSVAVLTGYFRWSDSLWTLSRCRMALNGYMGHSEP